MPTEHQYPNRASSSWCNKHLDYRNVPMDIEYGIHILNIRWTASQYIYFQEWNPANHVFFFFFLMQFNSLKKSKESPSSAGMSTFDGDIVYSHLCWIEARSRTIKRWGERWEKRERVWCTPNTSSWAYRVHTCWTKNYWVSKYISLHIDLPRWRLITWDGWIAMTRGTIGERSGGTTEVHCCCWVLVGSSRPLMRRVRRLMAAIITWLLGVGGQL
jgi:hypothetical protein